MRSVKLIFFLLLASWISSAGQDATDAGTPPEGLSFRLRTLNFVKNNEYSNPIVEGYTLIGYFLQPELVYTPSSKFSLGIGAHMLRYSGAEKFSALRPVVSARYNFARNAALTMGSLGGSDSHRMLDPHFSSERIYTGWAEEGIALSFRGDKLFNDTWLSWENFIFRGDSVREVFTFGESLKYSSSLISDIFRFEIPLQVQFRHYGGQISDYPEPVETYFNLATGARVNIDIAGKRYGTAGFEYSLFLSNELTGKSTIGLSSGNAEWFRLNYGLRNLQIEIGYWIAHNFYAPNGNPIFSCVSDYNEGSIIPDRRIATGSVNLTIIPESFFHLFAGLDAWYDTKLKRLDTAVALHLRLDRFFGRR
ncbi:MAG: hypothetical protein R6W81_03590 [Bacteroidales bacterium]